jgi:tyrosyl-tRNA synthetase
VLATEATALCHGREAAAAAADTARAVFEEGGSGEDLPQTQLPRGLFERGIAAFELFNRAGLAASNSEARRLIRGGGARINDAVVEDETRIVGLDDIGPHGAVKLSAGRKRHTLVRPL